MSQRLFREGKEGPLRKGELERAAKWSKEIEKVLKGKSDL